MQNVCKKYPRKRPICQEFVIQIAAGKITNYAVRILKENVVFVVSHAGKEFRLTQTSENI